MSLRQSFFSGKKAYTYDDIQIVPGFSTTSSRSLCDTKTELVSGVELDIPLVAAPMSTVCEWELSKSLSRLGGLGFIHRNMSIDQQADHVRKSLSNEGTVEELVKMLVSKDMDLELFVRHPHIHNYEDIIKYHLDLKYPNPKVGGAVGARGDFIERAQELVNAGVCVLLIDTAHGDHQIVLDAIKILKSKVSVPIIAGNVSSGDSALRLARAGVDAVRVGVGNGAVCETRIRTGVGTPQATAVFDCISTLEKYKFDVPVIADGGVRFPSDVAKALALGAKTVMIGSLFSGTKETPGILHKEGMWPNERLYKRYSGEASFDKKLRGGEKTNNVEGNSKRVPYKGKLKRIVNDIMEGVRSSMSYVGAESLSEYCEEDCTRFVEVTVSGMREAMPHLL